MRQLYLCVVAIEAFFFFFFFLLLLSASRSFIPESTALKSLQYQCVWERRAWHRFQRQVTYSATLCPSKAVCGLSFITVKHPPSRMEDEMFQEPLFFWTGRIDVQPFCFIGLLPSVGHWIYIGYEKERSRDAFILHRCHHLIPFSRASPCLIY
ncbi:hypothetical protein VTN02DRAFT_1580 [Thermoascus thermophilus]